MGILDTFRHVFGKHGVTLGFKTIERQEPSIAAMPLDHTVVKAQLLIHAEKDVQIEGITFIWMAARIGAPEDELRLAIDEMPYPEEQRGAGLTEFPLKLAAGQTYEEGCSAFIEDGDISSQLASKGWKWEDVRFYVAAKAAIYGSLSDAECQATLRIFE